jgi:Photosynthetic reaction centre cytochrome C subunit
MRILIAAAIAVALGAVASAQQWTPPTPKNLQVLPKDMPPRALVATMRSFAQGLGVRCQHCHVYKGTNADDLNAYDFANDEKEEKKIARVMLKMVMSNNDVLKDVGDPPAAGELKVTCYTCHRGDKHPVSKKPDAPPAN